MRKVQSLSIFLLALLVLGACNSPRYQHRDYAPVDLEVSAKPAPPVATGSIYQASNNITLFEDIRARQVGDIVTVILAELTNAAKSSDTTLDKSSSSSTPDPILAGRARVLGLASSLAFELDSAHAFAGDSASNQSNSLRGSIAVTVSEVLPNGNLYVQGEKWISINQGNEFIRLRGIIRPVDISATNAILSTQVADARIAYGGTGATAQVNQAGWLSRFFMSPLWPF